MSESTKRIKYTAKVRRGLASIRELVLAASDDRQPPTESIVKGWKAAKFQEFNQAMDWIEQETAEPAEGGEA